MTLLETVPLPTGIAVEVVELIPVPVDKIAAFVTIEGLDDSTVVVDKAAAALELVLAPGSRVATIHCVELQDQ